MKNKLVIAILLFLFANNLIAQIEGIIGGPVNVPSSGVVDGIYISEHIPTKRLIPYEYVREADVIWSKRVWQYIDLREKINHPLRFPYDSYQDTIWVRNASRWSLWTIIKNSVMDNEVTLFAPKNPYDDFGVLVPDGDQFKYPVVPSGGGGNYYTDKQFRDDLEQYLYVLGEKTFEAVPNYLGEDSVIVDDFTGEETTVTMEVQKKEVILSEHIMQYRLKEDWFFDKERSLLDVRILGIAPVIYAETKEGGVYKELFWLYFPQCRFVFNNYFTYNTDNDAQWMSFDDLFWKRRFSSNIYKASNVYERKIDSYAVGIDALMESDKIKEEIRTIEHDVWSF